MLHMARKADREIVWGHANRDAAAWCSAHTAEQVCTLSLQEAWVAARDGFVKRGGAFRGDYVDDNTIGRPIYMGEFLAYIDVIAGSQRRYVEPEAVS